MIIQPICRGAARAVPKLSALRQFSNNKWLVPSGFPYRPSNVFGELQTRMEQMERDFDRFFGLGFRPFLGVEHPTTTEFFRLKNPIIEEDGVKKFKLEFDVRRFRPEDVKISTDSKQNTLTIQAKTADEESHFEYARKISIPEGVKPTDLTCKYKADGVLVLEAPYTEPPAKEPPKDTLIDISHK